MVDHPLFRPMTGDDGLVVTRLFGGPGSGKTTALLDRVDELLESGVEVDDLLLVSYSRSPPGRSGAPSRRCTRRPTAC